MFQHEINNYVSIDADLLEKIKRNEVEGTLSIITTRHHFRIEEIEQLSKAILQNTKIKAFVLKGRTVLSSIITLMKGLKDNKSISHIYLDSNDLDSDGVKFGVLRLFHFFHPKKTPIQFLSISNNKIGDEGAKELAQVISPYYPDLKQLYLIGNNIGDEGIKALGAALGTSNELEQFVLANNKITSQTAKAFTSALNRQNYSLRILNVDHCGIGDEGAEAFVNCRMLREFSLNGNSIGDEGAKSLGLGFRNNWPLRVFSLRENNIGDEGAKSLSEGLNAHKYLHALYLDNNNIGDEGAKYLLKMLKYNKIIRIIGLKGNNISQVILDEINFLLERNKNLVEDNEKRKNSSTALENIFNWFGNLLDVSSSSGDASGSEKASLSQVRRSSFDDSDADTEVKLATVVSSGPASKPVSASKPIVVPKPVVTPTKVDKKSVAVVPVATAPTVTTATVTLPKNPLSDAEIAKFRQLISLDFLQKPSAPAAPVVGNAVVLDSRAEAQLKVMLNYHLELQEYIAQINRSPKLTQYYNEMLSALDNLVLAFKVINSGSVEGTNLTKEMISLGEQVLAGALSFLGVSKLVGMMVSVLAFVFGVLNDRDINALAFRVSRLFPNSSDNGNILKCLAILLTIHQQSLINNPPALPATLSPTGLYLKAKAFTNGRDTISATDALVMDHIGIIVKFLNSLSGESAPSINEWLPQLLALFKISLSKPVKTTATLTVPSTTAVYVQQAISVAVSTPASVSSSSSTNVDELAERVDRLEAKVTAPRSPVHTVGSGSMAMAYLSPNAHGASQANVQLANDVAGIRQQLADHHDVVVMTREELAALQARVQQLERAQASAAPATQNRTGDWCVVS